MGLFNMFSSESNAEDNRIAATDQAHVTRGSGNVSGQDNAAVVGARGSLTEAGGVSVAGSGKLKAGLDLTGAKTGNVTINDIGAVTDLARQFSQTLETVSGQANQTLANALSSQSGTVQSAVDASSGGAGTTNKTLLYVIAVIAAAVVALFYFKR
jgi:hypothetical protein